MGLSFTPIQIEWFYHLEGEKTKLNWFLLETALEHFSRIRQSDALEAYRKQYDEQQVAQFCTYYARRMKDSLLNCLRGRRRTVIHYSAYVDDFYPHHDEQMNRAIEDIAVEAWSHMLSACENCPQQCLADYASRSYVFDTYGDEGDDR